MTEGEDWRKLLDRLILASISLEQVRVAAEEEGSAIAYWNLAIGGKSFEQAYMDFERELIALIDD